LDANSLPYWPDLHLLNNYNFNTPQLGTNNNIPKKLILTSSLQLLLPFNCHFSRQTSISQFTLRVLLLLHLFQKKTSETSRIWNGLNVFWSTNQQFQTTEWSTKR